MDRPIVWIAVGLGAVLLLAALRWLWKLARAVQVERAGELFRLQHEHFEEMLLAAASQSGKPRGLHWRKCEIVGDAVLARTPTRGIAALVPVVIHFEPIAGSEMEDVPAAREPRIATAIFNFQRGRWHTAGRVVFNLDPSQALSHFGERLTPITHH
ncbi:MAG TPA: hypothetical protein VGI99_11625 [Gemmataceae bacterium]|jgi:hypothetical protein